MNFLWFVVFSTLEATAILVLILQLFRYRVKQHMPILLIASILFSFLSFALREEFGLTNYFPLITLIYITLFVFFVLKVPFFWAVVMSGIGNIAGFTLQTLIALVFLAANLYPGESFPLSGSSARLFQLIFSIITLLISNVLYRKGLGFAFNFDRFRLRAENIIILTVSIILFAVVMVAFIDHNVYFFAVIAFITLCFLIYLALRKERADLD